jgi:hypothetical protein
MIIYIYIYIHGHVSKSGTDRRDQGRKKRRKERWQVIMKYITFAWEQNKETRWKLLNNTGKGKRARKCSGGALH